MKRLFTFVLLLIICSVGFCSETVEQRIAKLEQTVKAQSDSLVIYKAKVAEIELQKSFLSDIYNGNAAWFIGIMSILFAFILLVAGFSFYDNIKGVREFKKKFDLNIEELKTTNQNELVNLQASVLESKADISRLYVQMALYDKKYALVVMFYINAIRFELENLKYKANTSSDYLGVKEGVIQIHSTINDYYEIIKLDIEVVKEVKKHYQYIIQNIDKFKISDKQVITALEKLDSSMNKL